MEGWTMWLFNQQRSNKQRQEEQREQTPEGTREMLTSVYNVLILSAYMSPHLCFCGQLK